MVSEHTRKPNGNFSHAVNEKYFDLNKFLLAGFGSIIGYNTFILYTTEHIVDFSSAFLFSQTILDAFTEAVDAKIYC